MIKQSGPSGIGQRASLYPWDVCPISHYLAPLELLAQSVSPSWTLLAWLLPLVMGVVVYPLVWRHWWGLTPLSEADWARLSPCISGSPMLLGLPLLRWNTASRICNAAVLGCVPGFRYLMISDRALETLPQRSVSAIVAHELGHVRNWHVVIRLLIVLAGGAIALVAIRWISLLSLEVGVSTFLTVLVPIGMCLYLLLTLRWIAPVLEHQADAYALKLLAGQKTSAEDRIRLAEELIQAIGELSVMAGISLERRTWLHPSWRQRRRFLLAVARGDRSTASLGWWIAFQTLFHLSLLVASGAILWALS
ncbi:MAG: M48 family metalloprotease [Pirellulaceae bacterium]